MGKRKVKERLLEELVQMQKDIEQRVEEQEHFINRFQMLVQHEGLFSRVVENLPYPIAIFDRCGVLTMANRTLLKEANLDTGHIKEGIIHLPGLMANGNAPVLEAVKAVFSGETTVLKEFAGFRALFAVKETGTVLDTYQSAVFFPVFENGGGISHGVVLFIK